MIFLIFVLYQQGCVTSQNSWYDQKGPRMNYLFIKTNTTLKLFIFPKKKRNIDDYKFFLLVTFASFHNWIVILLVPIYHFLVFFLSPQGYVTNQNS